ncbi:hypothetical protein [Adhaeretor mobilis]|uniref:Uncharacterized protein n=1 Tax=Adhaeretor mobilis TaxID=1930276 RepID=A0A517MXF8_9BACT|nr:hypothetical protein [Adhaeretor mobilis]QDS99566.1 hypothetical protein HG15A2_28900 [Adhaeretor mobilis]
MPRGNKHTAEQIIGKLREAKIALSEGRTQQEAAKQIGGHLPDVWPLA